MGIEKFFYNAVKNRIVTLNGANDPVSKLRLEEIQNIKTTHLFIDFTSIIYDEVAKILSDMNLILKIKLIPTHVYEPNIIGKQTPQIGGVNKLAELENKYHQYFGTSLISIIQMKPEEITHFIQAKLNDILEDGFIRSACELIETVSDKKKLKNVFIALDGIPTYAKTMEHVRRRYMTKLNHDVEDAFLEKYMMTMSENRYMYEKCRIKWDLSDINYERLSTKLSRYILYYLINTGFQKDLKINVINDHQYGEAEIKILDQIYKCHTMDHDSVISIYSLDTNMILLGLLANARIIERRRSMINMTPINVISKKADQKDGKSCIYKIDINNLAINIYQYIYLEMRAYRPINQVSIILDFVFLMIIFGNDFIPKFLTLDIAVHFDSVIDTYIEIMKKRKDFLVIQKWGHRELNETVLTELITAFANLEYESFRTYRLRQEYTTTGLQKIANSVSEMKFSSQEEKEEMLVENLEQFFGKLEILNNQIKTLCNDQNVVNQFKFSSRRMYELIFKNKLDYDTALQMVEDESTAYFKSKGTTNKTNRSESLNMIHEHITLKWVYEKAFLDNLRELCYYCIDDSFKQDLDYFYDVKSGTCKPEFDHRSFLILYISIFSIVKHNPNKFPRINFDLFRRNTSIHSYPYRKYYETYLIRQGLKPETESLYDTEVFKFNNLLDEYPEVVNQITLNLPSYSLEKMHGNYYVTLNKNNVSTDQIGRELIELNGHHATLRGKNIKEQREIICQQFINGLVWVFDYYLNIHMINRSSTWYYPYHFSPLISDICGYLKDHNNAFVTSHEFLADCMIDFKEYLNWDEYKILINHMNYNLPDKIKDSNVLPRQEYLDQIVKNIIQKKTTKQDVLATGTNFLSRCYLPRIMDQLPDFDQYVAVMRT